MVKYFLSKGATEKIYYKKQDLGRLFIVKYFRDSLNHFIIVRISQLVAVDLQKAESMVA